MLCYILEALRMVFRIDQELISIHIFFPAIQNADERELMQDGAHMRSRVI